MLKLPIVFIWVSLLLRGFDCVLIETSLSFTFNSDLSNTIAEFQVPSTITCIHKCRHLSVKMFYDGKDLCICFEDRKNNRKTEENNGWTQQGILMQPLKMDKMQVNTEIFLAGI